MKAGLAPLFLFLQPWLGATLPPIPGTDRMYGIMIDAGSGGSRAHLFQWKTRRFSTLPPPLSVPLTSVAWTEKVKPGLSAYWQFPESVTTVLQVLITWAKTQLPHVQKWWGYYPIYLKATAGLRELPNEARTGLIRVIRDWLRDNNTCPFHFEEAEAARTISGEEEAAYAWTAINYATGALMKYSWGSGTAAPKHAYGSMELGGASAQIAFYDPSQDVLANLFKVQVGQQRHWNIYAHSYLHYGYNSARRRIWGSLAEEAGCFRNPDNGTCIIRDKCLPVGFVYPPSLVPASSDGNIGIPPKSKYSPTVEPLIRSRERPESEETAWDECLAQMREPLGFVEESQGFCRYSHRGQCAFNGVYQPPMPDEDGPFGRFFLFGTYNDVWGFLNLTKVSTLAEVKRKGRKICAMSYKDLTKYNQQLGGDEASKRVPDLPEMCFLAVFTYAQLHHGYHINTDRKMASQGKVEYQGVKLKIGWPLGAMLYEINTLPWEYVPPHTPDNALSSVSSSSSPLSSSSSSSSSSAAASLPLMSPSSSDSKQDVDDDHDASPVAKHDITGNHILIETPEISAAPPDLKAREAVQEGAINTGRAGEGGVRRQGYLRTLMLILMAVMLTTLLYRYMNVLKPFSSPHQLPPFSEKQPRRRHYAMTEISTLNLGQPAVTSETEGAAEIDWHPHVSPTSKLLPSPSVLLHEEASKHEEPAGVMEAAAGLGVYGSF